ncbi:EcoAI/FtnUII family type I restriction enzme subunit R [Vibrio splendidus]
MKKNELTEQEIRNQFIRPNIVKAGWNAGENFREEAITKGQILVKGQVSTRSEKILKPDFSLYYKHGIPLGVIEAKNNKYSVDHGIEQAINYARVMKEATALDVPFIFSSNGDAFYFHDKTQTDPDLIEQIIPLDKFPSPEELWQKLCKWKGWSLEQAAQCAQSYHIDPNNNRTPRYYQAIAINRTIEAIADGNDRALLVMATGTGKTYTAFQIISRYRNYLIKKKEYQPRILFLADRNILVDQTMVNDFRPFKGVMAKLSSKGKVIERNDGKKEKLTNAINHGKVDTSYEIYLGLYQSMTGKEDYKKVFKSLPRDFFDLIVIDECHRGSVKADSAWREILEHFDPAIQVGLTATPKETKTQSNIEYFGDPIYTYSLKQGIEDGFLAPYKVIKIGIDIDAGWEPKYQMYDKEGEKVEDRLYNVKDYDRTLVVDSRTKLVARIFSDYLKKTNQRMAKTIIFCSDVDHAKRMRKALMQENADLVKKDDRYVTRITGDNKVGKEQLDYFIDPDEPYPVLVTTSELMTTGVDAKTCKFIVIDAEMGSMTKFKQVIGRGTRIHEEGKHQKTWFTIFDFKNVTTKIKEDDFNGPPISIYEPSSGDDVDDTKIDGQDDDSDLPNTPKKKKKLYLKEEQLSAEHVSTRVENVGLSGELEVESFEQYRLEAKQAFKAEYRSLNEFTRKWNATDKKHVIIEELASQGVVWEVLLEDVGKDLDPYDLICHIAFDQPPLTRQERARSVRKRNYFGKYSDQARQVLEALLEKYADYGISEIEDNNILKVQPLSDFGTKREIFREIFDSKDDYLSAIRELEDQIYLDDNEKQA